MAAPTPGDLAPILARIDAIAAELAELRVAVERLGAPAEPSSDTGMVARGPTLPDYARDVAG